MRCIRPSADRPLEPLTKMPFRREGTDILGSTQTSSLLVPAKMNNADSEVWLADVLTCARMQSPDALTDSDLGIDSHQGAAKPQDGTLLDGSIDRHVPVRTPQWQRWISGPAAYLPRLQKASHRQSRRVEIEHPLDVKRPRHDARLSSACRERPVLNTQKRPLTSAVCLRLS